MHPVIAAAHHTATPWHITPAAAAAVALVAALVIVGVLKLLGRLLTPRKPAAKRPGLPYASRK